MRVKIAINKGKNMYILLKEEYKNHIEDYAKTDDNVYISNNVVIEENSIFTACAEVSRSCIIGKNS